MTHHNHEWDQKSSVQVIKIDDELQLLCEVNELLLDRNMDWNVNENMNTETKLRLTGASCRGSCAGAKISTLLKRGGDHPTLQHSCCHTICSWVAVSRSANELWHSFWWALEPCFNSLIWKVIELTFEDRALTLESICIWESSHLKEFFFIFVILTAWNIHTGGSDKISTHEQTKTQQVKPPGTGTLQVYETLSQLAHHIGSVLPHT